MDPGPWLQEECDRFNVQSRMLFETCCKLLSGKYELHYEYEDICEDPDLEKYLANPKGFKRKK